MRLAELVDLNERERSSASAVQPPIIMPVQVDELDPKKKWIIRPSRLGPPSVPIERTHKRRVPLPLAIDFMMCGETHACLYIGHGQSKVAYRLIDRPFVLKLTAKQNEEPEVCRQLSMICREAQPAVKICSSIYAIGHCEEQDQRGTCKAEWFAWLAEYAIPVDKYIQGLNVDCESCLKIALYKQVIAAQYGFLLSDNNLSNLGVVDDTVVIIDTGSRKMQEDAISKGTMNIVAIRDWWKKLASLLP